MNKSESKFHNTKIKMNEALFKLLETKDFNQISVSELCKEAKINRSTFYAHYENTHELLLNARNDFMNDFFSRYEENADELDLKNIEVESFVSEKYIIPYLQFIKKNKKIFKTYITNINIFGADEFFNTLLNKVWIPACAQKSLTDKTIIKYMSKFYLIGMSSIILEWVNNNCEDDILFICEIIILCVRPIKNTNNENKI